MRLKQEPPTDVGVIVGRFQVAQLHEGHIGLIKSVCDVHSKVIIFLGLSACVGTRNNPLDYEARKQMLLQSFPDINVCYVQDMNDDGVWSKRLDEEIRKLISPTETVTLYGGRDGFLEHYRGRLHTAELEATIYTSGSEERKKISSKVISSPEFRMGAIWRAWHHYPRCMPTVDIAIIKTCTPVDQILMAQKPGEETWRFVGGFCDGKTSFEMDARREVTEETGIECGDMEYICSMPIDDWRYRNEEDGIVTTFFKANYVYGSPKPMDDISALKWFQIDNIHRYEINPNHLPLLEELLHRYYPKSPLKTADAYVPRVNTE